MCDTVEPTFRAILLSAQDTRILFGNKFKVPSKHTPVCRWQTFILHSTKQVCCIFIKSYDIRRDVKDHGLCGRSCTTLHLSWFQCTRTSNSLNLQNQSQGSLQLRTISKLWSRLWVKHPSMPVVPRMGSPHRFHPLSPTSQVTGHGAEL